MVKINNYKVKQLWSSIEDWISELGSQTCDLSDKIIILGDDETPLGINGTLLLAKEVIYNAIKKEKQLHLSAVKDEIKNPYYQEKFRLCMKGHKKQFEKRYSLFTCTFGK